MSALLIVLVAACAVLGVAVLALAALLRRAGGEARLRSADLDRIRDQLTALTTRQTDLEFRVRSQHAAEPADPADYVITFDQDGPVHVSTTRVASSTLGEPLIKVAALGHGVRHALREERRAHLAFQVGREYRRRRRASRTAVRRSR